jgi:hypothetical protein
LRQTAYRAEAAPFRYRLVTAMTGVLHSPIEPIAFRSELAPPALQNKTSGSTSPGSLTNKGAIKEC